MKNYPINFYTQGSMTIEEIDFLQKLSKNSSGDILEIGGFQGRSTIAMAEMLDDANRIYTIDTWSGKQVEGDVYLDKEVFLQNIQTAGFSNKVTALHGGSEMFSRDWAKKLGLLFIDGEHSYNAVKRDFHHFYHHVITSGIIAFHDYLSPKYNNTVIKAVNEIKQNYALDQIDHVGALIAFYKK